MKQRAFLYNFSKESTVGQIIIFIATMLKTAYD